MERRNYQNMEFLEKIIFGNWMLIAIWQCFKHSFKTQEMHAEPNFMFTEPKNSFFFQAACNAKKYLVVNHWFGLGHI